MLSLCLTEPLVIISQLYFLSKPGYICKNARCVFSLIQRVYRHRPLKAVGESL